MLVNINLINLGKKIKLARQKENLTQEALATLIGGNNNYIGIIENGRKEIKIEIFIKIAKVLHVSAVDLLGDIIGIRSTLSSE